jgi:integrase
MLLQGLRSQEVLDLNRDDLLLPEAQIRVRGKGNKTRFLPLAPEAAQLLDHYLRLERPTAATNALFVSLKGPARGSRMMPAGLRSLFRHHRRTTGVKIANPHRFRHYAEFRTMPSKISEAPCFRQFPQKRLGIVCADSGHGCWSNGNSIRLLL